MNFRATEAEFRYRFWIIAALFWLAFGAYRVDPMNFSVALARRILGGGANPGQVDHYTRAILAIGTLLAIAAALIRTWASAYLRSAVVHDGKLHLDRLIADGPYCHVRNPLYLGTILVALGIGTMASRTGFFILGVGIVLFTHRLILREEAALLATQGEPYWQFLARVPRLLPSLTPRAAAAGGVPNWKDALLGEAFMWGCAASMVVFLVTARLLYFFVVLAAGFAMRFLRPRAVK